MNKVTTLAGVTMLALATLTDARPLTPVGNQVGQLVDHLLVALQQESVEAYTELFPTLKEFHEVMENNRNFYGESLAQAQREFADEYTRTLVPALQESFSRALSEGKELGIDWSRITLVSWELTPSTASSSAFQIAMKIQYEGTTYTLVIDKALVLHDQVHVSPAIRIG
ncbi:MAG: hypothetical protein JNN04_17400 [Cyclobacteriaceae bacterium]|nr:hypothetical protein [Cyclobacteriaceae bacterium]